MQDVTSQAIGISGDVAVNQAVVSALAAIILQAAKKSKSPLLCFVNECTPWANRFAAVSLAALTSAGFTASYDAHGGTLIINGLTLQGGILFVWLAIRAYVFQHFTYKVMQSASLAKAVNTTVDCAKPSEPPAPLI